MKRGLSFLILVLAAPAFAHLPEPKALGLLDLRAGLFLVRGNPPAQASSVTVNGQTAQRYSDFTFASTNHFPTNGQNTFTFVAENTGTLGTVTNVTVAHLPTPITVTSDLNGNLTFDGLRTFAYDAENQLTNVSVSGEWKSEFVYDGLGRKRIERDYNWTGSGWQQTNETRFVYDGMLVLQELHFDPQLSTNDPQQVITYTRGLELSGSRQGAGGIGGLLARTDGTGSAFYHADGAGNVTALMDAQQHIVARYLYDPFGRQLGQWGELASDNHYRFSSKEVHPQSGLYYYGYRHYDPALQRWLTEDPIGHAGGLNLYRFVLNSPLRYVDPDGRAPQLIGVGYDPFSGVSIGLYGPDLPDPGPPRGGGSVLPSPDTVEGAWVRGFVEGLGESLFGRSDQDVVNSVIDFGPLSLGGPKGPKPCPLPAKVKPRPTPPYWERPPQYYISDGVRRSLAARESGTPTIQARLTRPGQQDELVNVHLDQLHSPKSSIDIADPRFSPSLRPNYPPIEIQPLGLPGQPQSFPLLSIEVY